MLANIIMVALQLVPAAIALVMTISAYQWSERARCYERRAWLMEMHLTSLGCRVETTRGRDGIENVRFVWPEINDFVLENEPERMRVDERFTEV